MQIKDFAICNPKNLSLNDFEYINYIDTSSVTDGRLENTQCLAFDYPSRAKRTVKKEDILISSVRPILRHNYYVKSDISNAVGSTGFIQVRITDKKIALPRFLYYYLTTDRNIEFFNSIAESSQSTFPSFNKDVIEELEFLNISIVDQQHIVNTRC